MSSLPIEISFEYGSLVASNASENQLPEGFIWDHRTKQWRAPASSYRESILHFEENDTPYSDLAKDYDKGCFDLQQQIIPRKHQTEALTAWLKNRGRGVVGLPTGAGKTILAVLAIEKVSRPTLIIVPTIDLMRQWQQTLAQFFDVNIGMLGGGSKEVTEITVATYDSALIHVEQFGNKFGMFVVDECHHLPAPQYQTIALSLIAPFRLGLSATIERADGQEERIYELLGPKVYEAQVKEMTGQVLAPYDVKCIKVDLSEQEREDYDAERKIYKDFLQSARVNFSSGNGWQEFIMKTTRFPGGKRAMKAYRKQKHLAQAASGKINVLWTLLQKHKHDRILIFTDDNALAYRIGRLFVLPVLTHHTKVKERQLFLDSFKNGSFSALVTSRVLNEGVDVPEANVAVVVSGSGGVREHVQRLGRILRQQPGKRALLYELVSNDTNELYVNRRRREHHAYQKSP